MLILNLVVFFPFRNLFEDFFPKEYSFSEAYRMMSSSTHFTGYISAIAFVMFFLVMLYFIMLEKRMGQTIGKMIMKIYIVSDINGLKAWQVIVRNLVFVPVFPFILLWLIDPLFMFFTKTNQRLAEVLSKTKVVERYNLQ